MATLDRVCPDCGHRVGHYQRTYCHDCWPTHRLDAGLTGTEAAQRMLDTAEGRHTRGTAIAIGKAAAAEQAIRDHGYQPDDWNRIYPTVRDMSLADIMDTCGIAISHASRIRTGKARPHSRHWSALAAIASKSAAASERRSEVSPDEPVRGWVSVRGMIVELSRPSRVLIATATTTTLSIAINLATNAPTKWLGWVIVCAITLVTAGVATWRTGTAQAPETRPESPSINRGCGTQNNISGGGTQNSNSGSGIQIVNQIGSVGRIIRASDDVET